MQKLFYSFISIICFLWSGSSVGYISGKMAVDEKLIYCPNEVVCTLHNEKNSCKIKGNSSPYWDNNNLDIKKQIPAGTYKLKRLVSISRTPQSDSVTSCMYGPDFQPWIVLHNKIASNLRAYQSKTTKWFGSPDAFCNVDKSSSECPLTERSGIGVVDKAHYYPNESGRISFEHDNNKIKLEDRKLEDRVYENRSSRTFISYENANSCWSSKECKINIMQKNKENNITYLIGSIVVDMDNKMKILQILTNPASGINVRKIEPFNTIELKEIGAPISPAPLQINNLTTIDLDIFINHQPVLNIMHSEVGFDAVEYLSAYKIKELCLNTKECSFDITTGEGKALIGSVVFDAEKMNVLSVKSTRAPEIVVNKISNHKIEIIYPN